MRLTSYHNRKMRCTADSRASDCRPCTRMLENPWVSCLGFAVAAAVPYLGLKWYNGIPRHRSPPCPSSIDGVFKMRNQRRIDTDMNVACIDGETCDLVRITSVAAKHEKHNDCVSGVRLQYLNSDRSGNPEFVLVYTWDSARGRYALVGHRLASGVAEGDGNVRIDIVKPMLGLGDRIDALNLSVIDETGVFSAQLVRTRKIPQNEELAAILKFVSDYFLTLLSDFETIDEVREKARQLRHDFIKKCFGSSSQCAREFQKKVANLPDISISDEDDLLKLLERNKVFKLLLDVILYLFCVTISSGSRTDSLKLNELETILMFLNNVLLLDPETIVENNPKIENFKQKEFNSIRGNELKHKIMSVIEQGDVQSVQENLLLFVLELLLSQMNHTSEPGNLLQLGAVNQEKDNVIEDILKVIFFNFVLVFSNRSDIDFTLRNTVLDLLKDQQFNTECGKQFKKDAKEQFNAEFSIRIKELVAKPLGCLLKLLLT